MSAADAGGAIAFVEALLARHRGRLLDGGVWASPYWRAYQALGRVEKLELGRAVYGHVACPRHPLSADSDGAQGCLCGGRGGDGANARAADAAEARAIVRDDAETGTTRRVRQGVLAWLVAIHLGAAIHWEREAREAMGAGR